MSHAIFGLWGWYIPCHAALRVRCFLMDGSPTELNRVNGRSKKVTILDLRHTRREGRAWLSCPSLEWRMNEAMKEDWSEEPTWNMALIETVLIP